MLLPQVNDTFDPGAKAKDPGKLEVGAFKTTIPDPPLPPNPAGAAAHPPPPPPPVFAVPGVPVALAAPAPFPRHRLAWG